MNETGTWSAGDARHVHGAWPEDYTVADLVHYRISKEVWCDERWKPICQLFMASSRSRFENTVNGDVHLAMVMGDVRTDDRCWCACILRT